MVILICNSLQIIDTIGASIVYCKTSCDPARSEKETTNQGIEGCFIQTKFIWSKLDKTKIFWLAVLFSALVSIISF